ncbi:thiamine-phosphate kinase [Quisquiliibacterium transsilvanicum]|uniref:Thiamine-monophosphate kinase n=1 Tax=Quisquiliibacterium transsilvanicum TaxID=1549638 RepID=A0A7W8MAK4_9BURK|nr:thiamine-phosphate kinase [Quisquiliibacterium transsilvanicum]MBB5273445.1 thiamine-monophosphate kinase [Quisquiliibacterium transsilvanicum]
MGEFELISRFFDRGPARRSELGVGDDCAILRAQAPGTTLAVATDMLVAGRHFLASADPASVGHKALAVNLSDLAAMGARPLAFTLALALPDADERWLEGFSAGMFALADQHDCELIGGDTTRGPLNVCITVLGELPVGAALRRDRAEPGDDLWVSGELGGAALAVRLGEAALPAERARLDRPQPRVALGLALRHLARAAIDVSDGLVGDLGHVCERSRVGAEVQWPAVPLAPGLAQSAAQDRPALALAGGDDYELLFSAAPENRSSIEALAGPLGLRLSRIGRIVPGQGVRVLDERGRPMAAGLHAYDHFA